MPLLLFVLLIAWRSEASPAARVFDDAFLRRGDLTEAARALEGYQALWETSGRRDVGLCWRVSMAAYYYGQRAVKDEAGKSALFSLGRDAALQGIERDPQCAPCFFWGGVNMAKYGDTVGILKTLVTLPRVRQLLRASADLDPAYAYGGAYRVLALIDARVPGLFGGDDTRARELFEKAIAAAPDEPMNYLGLAKLLEDSFGQATEALLVARKALAFPLPGAERVESRDARRELQLYVSTRMDVASSLP